MNTIATSSLLQTERTLAGLHLVQPDRSAGVKQRGQAMAEQIREEFETLASGSLDETMASLRGRS